MYTVDREITIPSSLKEQAIVVQSNYKRHSIDICFYVFADEESARKLESNYDVAKFRIKKLRA